MNKIQFSDDEKQQIIQKIKKYFVKELNQQIGDFDTEFLLDFMGEELGAHFYNKGLLDAQAIFSKRADDLVESIYELEMPTNLTTKY